MTLRQDVEKCLAAGERVRALELSAALLECDPADASFLELHAAALMSNDKLDAAVALLIGPASAPEAGYALKAALALCQRDVGDLENATQTFRSALNQLPNDFSLRLAYAECLDMQHDVEAAVTEYFRAITSAQRQGRWLNDSSTGPAIRARVQRAMDVIDAARQSLFERTLQPHIDAFGRESMSRISEALAVYLGVDAEPGRDPRQKPNFFWMPGLPARPFYDREQFAWYAALESATAAIREELCAILDSQRQLTPFLLFDARQKENDYLGGDPQSRAWDAFFFYRHGQCFDDALTACPNTANALSNVPLTGIAAHAPEVLFSVLAPQTHIKSHHGVTNTRVVTHLPLVIPDGDCKLQVGGMEHAWQEGRCITFDDTFLHEAWNRTDQRRVVLILDTWNPDLATEECSAIKDLIESLGDFNLRGTLA